MKDIPEVFSSLGYKLRSQQNQLGNRVSRLKPLYLHPSLSQFANIF